MFVYILAVANIVSKNKLDLMINKSECFVINIWECKRSSFISRFSWNCFNDGALAYYLFNQWWKQLSILNDQLIYQMFSL